LENKAIVTITIYHKLLQDIQVSDISQYISYNLTQGTNPDKYIKLNRKTREYGYPTTLLGPLSTCLEGQDKLLRWRWSSNTMA
jgi:hypothetical protein